MNGSPASHAIRRFLEPQLLELEKRRLTLAREIKSQADLPIIVFEYPPAQGVGYSPETLAELAKIESVVGEVIPELKGKLDGLAIRVPTPNVSIVDFVAVLKKTATADELNAAFRESLAPPETRGRLEALVADATKRKNLESEARDALNNRINASNFSANFLCSFSNSKGKLAAAYCIPNSILLCTT